MGTFLVYILKSTVCLAVFYLFYRLLLSKETFHRFNRIALLGVMVLSCLLPLIQVTVKEASPVNMQVMSMEDLLLMYQWNRGAATVEEGSHTLRWQEMLVLVYFAGLLFVIVRHLWSLGRMLFLIRHSRCEKLDHGVRLVIHHHPIAPFSWMRYIVISGTDLKEGGHYILVHEQAHIRLRHSWDLLLTELCAWVQWFNPAIWLLKQELQNIHEYEADEEVLRQGIQAKEYQMLLIKKAVGARLYSIANSFNHSSLKKRITMMIRRKSNPWARAKYLYVLPLAAVTVAAFARPEISQPLDEISSVKVNDLSAVLETYADKNVSNPAEKDLQLKKDSSAQKVVTPAASDNQPFDVVEQMPEFPGGMQDSQAVAVKYTMPVTFSLEGSKNKPQAGKDDVGAYGTDSTSTAEASTLQIRQSDKDSHTILGKEGQSPMVLIDDVEVSTETMNKLDPQRIESVTVLKDVSATAKYGKKGKYGVILITTKKK